MNCKPGDLAVVVKIFETKEYRFITGQFLTVLKYHSKDQFGIIWTIEWACKDIPNKIAQTIIKRGKVPRKDKIFSIPDSWIRPIRPAGNSINEQKTKELETT